jgi:hypothetical protein
MAEQTVSFNVGSSNKDASSNSSDSSLNSTTIPTLTPVSIIFADPAPFDLITPMVIAFAIIGAIAFSCLLLFRKHRKTTNQA